MSTYVDSTGMKERVSSFLALEADLADGNRYTEWLELWAPDAIYWVPSNEDDYDPSKHVSIIYDDHSRLQERCFRLSVEGAHSQDPPSRLCRVIGNITLVPDPASAPDEVAVNAKMVLVEVRSGIKTVYGGRLEYRLLIDGDSFKIKRKKVVLLDNDEPLGNLTFLL